MAYDATVRHSTANLYPFRFIAPEEYKVAFEIRGLTVGYLETVARTYSCRKEYFEFVVVEAQIT